MELLAILGRGIQRESENGPWVLTEDLEMCDEEGAHLPVRVPVDDGNPNCLIGGGDMNLRAGYWLVEEHHPRIVVCAWGMRSKYLVSVDGPTESQVMYSKLREMFQISFSVNNIEFLLWPKNRTTPGRSNTDRELQNIFKLAVERNFTKVGMVTVQVHYARALLMAQRHLVKPEFANLELQFYVSENVLLHARPDYGSRIRAVYSSKAFTRSIYLETRGINRLLAGTY